MDIIRIGRDSVILTQLIRATGIPLEVWKIIYRMKGEDVAMLARNIDNMIVPRMVYPRVRASHLLYSELYTSDNDYADIIRQCDEIIEQAQQIIRNRKWKPKGKRGRTNIRGNIEAGIRALTGASTVYESRISAAIRAIETAQEIRDENMKLYEDMCTNCLRQAIMEIDRSNYAWKNRRKTT